MKKGIIAMNTTVKTNHGPAVIPMEARMLSKRKLFIEGEITPSLPVSLRSK